MSKARNFVMEEEVVEEKEVTDEEKGVEEAEDTIVEEEVIDRRSTVTPKINRAPELNELASNMVILSVDGKDFALHKDLAVYHSEVLADTLSGETIDGATQKTEFNDTTETAVSLFIRWAYSGKLEARCGHLDRSAPEYYEVGFLAIKWHIPELQNAVITAIKACFLRDGASPFDPKAIYENTTASDPLRKFAVDFAAMYVDPRDLTSARDDLDVLPKEYLLDLAVAALKLTCAGRVERDFDLSPYLTGDSGDEEETSGDGESSEDDGRSEHADEDEEYDFEEDTNTLVSTHSSSSS